MGASTAQNLFCMKPDKFTALVSIARVPDLSHPDEIRKKKIWLIHGKQDTDNPYSGSGRLYEILKGNRQLTFTTFTHLEHNNIMVPYLLTDEIPRWLFNPRRRPQEGF
jgi:predicted peptidase